MMAMEPPEPLCPRCKAYISEEDEKYCPHCYGELDFSELDFESVRALKCPDCERYVPIDEIVWRCGKCGYDGRERRCCACGKIMNPQEDDLCNKCQDDEFRQQMEDPDYWDDYDEYYADMAEAEERRGYEGQ